MNVMEKYIYGYMEETLSVYKRRQGILERAPVGILSFIDI